MTTAPTAAGTAASAMTLLEQMTDGLANNLANVNTPGFQSIVMQLQGGPPVNVSRASDAGVAGVGTLAGMPVGLWVAVDQRPGAVQLTGNPLDLALTGPGYFLVNSPTGPALTRDGAFRLDGAGQIVTARGDPVLGTNGPIVVPAGAKVIRVGEDGTVSADGAAVAQLRFAAPPDPTAMVPLGGGLYQSTAPIAPATTPPHVAQGSLEMSNASSIEGMVQLITILRAYQQLADAMKMDDTTKTLATQNVGQV